MRKLTAIVLALGLVATVGAAPVSAGGKKKKVHETFGAFLLPFPKLAAWGDPLGIQKPGCSAGQEGVHWVGQEFTAPGKGTLRLYAEGFTGDWDLYIFVGDSPIPVARSEGSQVDASAPPEEEISFPMKPKQKVLLVACNWLGDPNVEAHYEGVFK